MNEQNNPNTQNIPLKEAFQYQKYLLSLINDITRYLSRSANVIETKSLHLRKAVNADATNEEVNVISAEHVDAPVDDIIRFLSYLLSQRDILAKAITNAKRTAATDIDSACSLNSTRQEVARTLLNLSRLKDSEETTSAMDYKFNAEGNQVSYRYNVITKKTVPFDRVAARRMANKLLSVSDDVSAKIDRTLIDTGVNYIKPFDTTCSWNEAYDEWITQQNKRPNNRNN